MRVLFYLDDLIVKARKQEWAMFHTSLLIRQLSSLDFAINWKKSNPHSLQRMEYLGIVLYSHALWAVLSQTTSSPSDGGEATQKRSLYGTDCYAGVGAYNFQNEDENSLF